VTILWSLVLAAGAGRRLAGVTGGIPKQFWRADGVRTLLERTLDRSALVAPARHTVIVVDRSHAGWVARLPPAVRSRRLVYQPRDVGTAAGILVGLMEILAADPRAAVVLMPSDHGVRRPGPFAADIVRVARALRATPDHVVLFGAAPGSADTQYGWIQPSEAPNGHAWRRVAGFVEKPPLPLARALFASGAVWNTMVLVARAASLIALYERHLPALLDVFQPALRLDPEARRRYLDRRYEDLPHADFSRDVLGRADGLALHVWPADIGWSDLGTPERLGQWNHAQADARLVS
jgi:mannose-1-phosphate guanylyltransferase